METQLKEGTRWLYIGPDPGCNTIHTVTSVEREEVTTWSNPVPSNEKTEAAGWSWLGPVPDFLRFFRPICSTTQTTNAT